MNTEIDLRFGLQTILIFLLVTCNKGEEEILMSYTNTDPLWRWVTMYRLGPGSGWEHDSASGSYTTCDLISTKVNNTESWLISDYIPLNNARTVTLTMSFTARKCDLGNFPFCKQSIGIYSNENDVSKVGGVTMETIKAGNFTFVGNATAYNVWSVGESPHENLVNITFPVKNDGVYVGFRDTGACAALLAVRMTSLYCPRTVSGGAVFNKTGVALPGYDNKVKGKCLEMSENIANGSGLYLRCLSNGSWSSNLQVTCQCKAGYQPGQRTCQACPPGLYKPLTGNSICTVCLANTYSNEARDECYCKHGYYRSASDKRSDKCTAPPSPPRDLNSTLIGEWGILLSWQRPLSDGGRNDVRYSLSCFRCNDSSAHQDLPCKSPCGDGTRYNPSSNQLTHTHVIVNGLVPGSTYLFKVLAKNGVSDLVKNSSENFQEIRLFVLGPAAPKMLISYIGEDLVVLYMLRVNDHRSTSNFRYSLSCKLCDRRAPDCVTCHESCSNAIKYHPPNGFNDKSLIVVTGLNDNAQYLFSLSMTERDDIDYYNITSMACVTTKQKETGTPNETASTKQQEMITTYSKIAFGLSGGFLICSALILVMSVCLRRKWFKTAMSQSMTKQGHDFQMTTKSNEQLYQNGIKPNENIMYVEETILNNQ